MAKFCGKVGYIKMVEDEPGYWVEEPIERTYYGDVSRINSQYKSNNNQINDNIVINNIISIVADPYANENFQHIRYVVFMGTKWKVTNAEIKYPRIILTLGGMYNEEMAGSSKTS